MAANTNYEKYRSNGTLLGNALEWVDARFPATSLWRAHLSEYHAPKNFNFWYFFGSIALVVLVIQIVTGIFLTMNYKPDGTLNADGIPRAFA
ncbi:MAG: cytochrome b, partial [Azoarcus sp.]|nr:cytochrome b [Azoarcus sp.]